MFKLFIRECCLLRHNCPSYGTSCPCRLSSKYWILAAYNLLWAVSRNERTEVPGLILLMISAFPSVHSTSPLTPYLSRSEVLARLNLSIQNTRPAVWRETRVRLTAMLYKADNGIGMRWHHVAWLWSLSCTSWTVEVIEQTLNTGGL